MIQILYDNLDQCDASYSARQRPASQPAPASARRQRAGARATDVESIDRRVKVLLSTEMRATQSETKLCRVSHRWIMPITLRLASYHVVMGVYVLCNQLKTPLLYHKSQSEPILRFRTLTDDRLIDGEELVRGKKKQGAE